VGHVSTLDFAELDRNPPGESFEALVRLIGERLDLIVQWSGRGADGGRDMIFIEHQRGPLKARSVRWLVNCKDNSESNKAVSEKDVGSIIDKVKQHQCDGFLLATSTTASTGLKEKLDKLDTALGGEIHTQVWDRFALTNMLLTPQFADLLLQFFPRQRTRDAVQQLDAARQVVEASLPRFVIGLLRQHLMSYAERMSLVTGENVWPHDKDQQILIDKLNQYATERSDLKRAAEIIQELHFDAFMAFIDALVRNFPLRAERLLRSIAKTATDMGVCYNSIEILREANNFSLEDEIEITRRYDSDTLFELYHELAHQILEDTGVWDWRLPNDIQQFADNVELLSARLDDLEFLGEEAVCLRAHLRLMVRGTSSDPEEPSPGKDEFSYNIEAHFEADGIEIESIR
jgi:hypothetical protein